MSDPSTCIDKTLLMKVAAGDEQSFRRLFAAYHQQLGAFIFRLTESAELAEEIVQDVFLKIWLNRETLEGVQNFRAYLFVISKNHALNCLRKVARERILKKQLEEDIEPVMVENRESNDYYSLLDQAIDQLPPQQRKVYILSRHQRLKYAEIAKQLDISHETVKKYLQIATTAITAYVHANIEINIVFIALLIFF